MTEVTKSDSLTDNYYKTTGFDPSKTSSKYSYTSHRVTVPLYNKYKAPSSGKKPKVFGYYTDWALYDGRETEPNTPAPGRGVDLGKIPAEAYDKIILGFVGIIGDEGEKKGGIIQGYANVHYGQGAQFTVTDKHRGRITFLDLWSDAQITTKVGSISPKEIPWTAAATDPAVPGAPVSPDDWYKDERVNGLFAGLSALKKKNTDLKIAMSIGGWTMSNAFSNMADKPDERKNFCDSVVWHLKRFPQFDELDIDWEYPGASGNGNPHDKEKDKVNYAKLITELTQALNDNGLGHVEVSIAISAVPNVIDLSGLTELIKAGVKGLNVMTYDFFGTGWADFVTHHTSLYENAPPEGDFEQPVSSVNTAVQHLLTIPGVTKEMIYVGYAGYSRNAIVDKITNVSPLEAEYTVSSDPVVGSFESGTTEWYDLIYNYLDLNGKGGKNGFKLFTDTKANADFLYNQESKVFMSIDTPRTVKEKGEYVVEHGLGGLFTWTIDNDSGILVNAAREGLGYQVTEQKVDMKDFYFEGDTGSDIPPPEEGEYLPPTDLKLIQSTHVTASLSFKTVPADAEHIPVRYEGVSQEEGKAAKIIPLSVSRQVVEFTAYDLQPEKTYTIYVKAIYEDGAETIEADSDSIKLTTRATPVSWKANTEYKVGDLVLFAEIVYQAQIDHKSTFFDNPQADNEKWKMVIIKNPNPTRSLNVSQFNNVTLDLNNMTVTGEPTSIVRVINQLKISAK